MDKQLSRMAAEDPTRLLRLNQRMQTAARGTQPQRPSSRALSPGSGTHSGAWKQATAVALPGGAVAPSTLLLFQSLLCTQRADVRS